MSVAFVGSLGSIDNPARLFWPGARISTGALRGLWPDCCAPVPSVPVKKHCATYFGKPVRGAVPKMSFGGLALSLFPMATITACHDLALSFQKRFCGATDGEGEVQALPAASSTCCIPPGSNR